MARSTFGERFVYSLWLIHLRTGSTPSWRDVGRAVDRSGEAVSAWPGMDTAPDSHTLRTALSAYTGLPAEWLFDEEGEAPQPLLWAEWSKARRRQIKQEPPVVDEFPRSARRRKEG